ncbi:MAG: PD40 domain-containing protein, partial [Gemmatimonadetes bacterium]|nr:PD40 domain-containing protein [Gemmatimonadota bacterium]
MTFLDVQDLRSFGSEAPSPDGRWMLYTISTPDWEKARSQTDIHLVSLQQGVASTRQLTFTKDHSETSPQWSRDGQFFVYLSNRDAPSDAARQNQLYLMRTDGGEARKITDAKDGVADFAFTRDGRWLVYRAGKSGEQQLYRLAVAAIAAGDAEPEQLTRQPAGVGRWSVARDSKRLYVIGADSVDQGEKARLDKDFTVNVFHQERPLDRLWALDLDPVRATRLTQDPAYSVTGFTISPDSRWVGFRAVSSNRFERTRGGMVMGGESNLYTDLYLLEAATGQIERLTRNQEIGEGGPSFSPDGRWVAFTAPRDLTRYTRGLTQRVYLRAVAQRGGEFRRLGDSFDGNVGIDFWSADGNTIYFNEGIRATTQLLALDVARGSVRQLTNQDARLSVERHDDSGVLLINYSGPSSPSTVFTVASLDQVTNRSAWRQLT